jgi:hypothetical protein
MITSNANVRMTTEDETIEIISGDTTKNSRRWHHQMTAHVSTDNSPCDYSSDDTTDKNADDIRDGTGAITR